MAMVINLCYMLLKTRKVDGGMQKISSFKNNMSMLFISGTFATL